MLFTGTISAKPDAKGRVFFPSEFRRRIPDGDTELVLKRDVYQRCLVVYPQSVWRHEISELRTRLNRWNPADAMLFRQFMADVVMVTLDANGRFLIPRDMADYCGISREVTFIGVDDRVEMWSSEQMSSSFLSAEQFAEAMSTVSNRFAPGEAAGSKPDETDTTTKSPR